MLASMSPGEFDEWVLDHQDEPWGDDWLQASVIATAIINEMRRQASPESKDFLPLDKFVPKESNVPEESGEGSITSLTMMRARIGV